MTKEEFLGTLGIQLKEVQKCAMMPEDTWNLLAVKQQKKKAKEHYSAFKGDVNSPKRGESINDVRGVKVVRNTVQITDIPGKALFHDSVL